MGQQMYFGPLKQTWRGCVEHARTFGGRDDKVDFSFPEEHQGTRKLVPEQVSLSLRASALSSLSFIIFPEECH